MTDPKRAEIKSRIVSAQARHEERREYSLVEKIEDGALEAKDKFVSFAKEHPVATVAGGLVIGIVIAGMFKGPRRAAIGAAAASGARAAGLAAIGSEIAMGFAAQLLDGAQDARRSGARKLDRLGGTLSETARNLGNGAAHRASDAAEAAQSARENIARRISSAIARR